MAKDGWVDMSEEKQVMIDPWSSDEINILIELWKEGKSGGQIAIFLGRTRSGVMGKIAREGLQRGKVRKVKAQIPVRAPSPGRPKKETLPPPPTKPKKPFTGHYGNLACLDLEEHLCRYPMGDPKDTQFRFCLEDVQRGSIYCEEHHKLCHSRIQYNKEIVINLE